MINYIKNKMIKTDPLLFEHFIKYNIFNKMFKYYKIINIESKYKLMKSDIIIDYCISEKLLFYIKSTKYIYIIKDIFFNAEVYSSGFNKYDYYQSYLEKINDVKNFYLDVYKFNTLLDNNISDAINLNQHLNLLRYNFLINNNNIFDETFKFIEETTNFIVLENIQDNEKYIHLDLKTLLENKKDIYNSVINFFNMQNVEIKYSPFLFLKNIHKNLWNYYDIPNARLKMNYLMKGNLIPSNEKFIIFYDDDYIPSENDCFYCMILSDKKKCLDIINAYKKLFFRNIKLKILYD